jgi:hypothetical protein
VTARAVLLASATLALAAAAPHPNIFITRDSAARARDNVKRYRWARETAAAIRAEADRWLPRDDAWLRAALPKAGAAYAYGLSNCPVCGGEWGAWGSKGASFDHPHSVVCTRGHRMPDAAHPDPGTGYVAPDGRTHYFIGVYNAFVIERLTFDALENLVYAYTLTGEERYAAKASVILDAIAAIYPGSHKGCWDYPSNPPSGRLDRPWYQASRVLVHYVDHYDQLYGSPSMDAPSVTAGLTRRKNIEDNLLRDGGLYCYQMSKAGRLHNGEADYLRGALAVGLALDIPEYVRWAVDGPFGIRVLLDNALDRDGQYFEVTPMYSDHTRELYFTFLDPLLHSRVEPYPNGLDLYRHPKLQLYFQPHNLALFGAGRIPRYGDVAPAFDKRPAPARPFDRSDYDFLEKLWARTRDAVSGSLLNWMAAGRIEHLRSPRSTSDASGATIPDRRIRAGMSLYREPGDALGGSFPERSWLLFHAAPPPPAGPIPEPWMRRLTGSHFLGQKGFGVLRAGEGDAAQEVVIRYGPSLNHTHYDALGVNYVARGYELTYDLGYGHTAATQTQVGWARQTASHNTVIVNERSQLEGGRTTGSLHLFADSPGVRAIDVSAEANYSKEGVSEYRRLAALVAAGSEPYLIDVFRVRGGRRHDWSFHALAAEATLEGVALGPAAPGSLAAPDIDWRARQGADGDMKGRPNAPSWIAPPGNGYGFLSEPRRGTPAGAWTAAWRIDAATWLRVHMAATPGVEVATALANGLYPHYPQARYVFARRAGERLASVYVAAIEPGGATARIRSVERLPGADDTVNVKVTHRDGAEDLVSSAPTSFTHARIEKGRLASVTLAGSAEWSGHGWRIAAPARGWTGRIATLDAATSSFTTTATPDAALARGATIVFRNPAYSQTSAYRIARVERTGVGARIVLEGAVSLGVGQVEAIADATRFTSMIPHEYLFSDRASGDQGYFRGKQIRTASGATARIGGVRVGTPTALTVDSTAALKAGDRFEYLDLQAGDEFQIVPTLYVDFRGPRPKAPAGVAAVRR